MSKSYRVSTTNGDTKTFVVEPDEARDFGKGDYLRAARRIAVISRFVASTNEIKTCEAI